MPATYSHKYTSAEIARKRSSFCKKPELEKSIEYKIFGYEVDQHTFKKYSKMECSIGFTYCNLAGIERLLSNADWIIKHPDMAAEAQQIRKRIIAEIAGKDVCEVKTHNTAGAFIAALNEIYTNSRTEYDAIHRKLNRAKEKMESCRKEAMENPGDLLADSRFHVAKEEYKIAETEVQNEHAAMLYEHNSKVKELREKFEAFLEDQYSADPGKVDAATMQLLAAGICSPRELARLADKNQDNPVMIRIIGNHAETLRAKSYNDMTRQDQAIIESMCLAAKEAKNGKREMEVFDSAATTVLYGLGSRRNDYDQANKMHTHISDWMEGYKQKIEVIPSIPEENKPIDSSAGSGE